MGRIATAVVILGCAAILYGQVPGPVQIASFEVASVRVNQSGGHSFESGMMTCYDTDPTKPILSWKTAWTTARTSAGVSCRFQDLRHSCVTRLLERGASFATVATVMGWSPGTATKMAKRYGHIDRSAQRDALALLDPRTASQGQDQLPSSDANAGTRQTVQ
jgi:hypothetical protein